MLYSQAGGSRPCGSGREGRAAVDGASDQKKSSCGQEGGKERQGQAERQRRYQFELGQFQDMLAGTSPGGCNAAKFAAPLVVAVVQDPSQFGLLCVSLIKAIAGFTVKKAVQLTAAADAFRPCALGESCLPCRFCFP